MQKEFVPYEEALALKELGFDEPCFGAHGAWGFMSSNDVNSLSDEVTQEHLDNKGYNEEDGVCLAPTFSQAFRWFREKHNLKVSFSYWNGFNGMIPDRMQYKYECNIVPNNNKSITVRENGRIYFDTYEEAELACLKKLIELVKQTP